MRSCEREKHTHMTILRDFPTIGKDSVENHTVHILHSGIMLPPYTARFILALWNRLNKKVGHCIKRSYSDIIVIQSAPDTLKVPIFIHKMDSVNLSCRMRPGINRDSQRA